MSEENRNILIPMTPTTVRFWGMRGTLVQEDDDKQQAVIENILHMDRTRFEKIYSLDDGWAGSYLFVFGKSYEYIQCGSGRPIVKHLCGMLE